MAQSTQATPTLQANLGGVNTTVNLRDWLNTRLSPFLKKAIIESLESEAQYPLQWLGEHLIQQSILFEGNPDSTNIKERFVYKHDISSDAAPALAQAQTDGQIQLSNVEQPQETSAQPASVPQPAVSAMAEAQPEPMVATEHGDQNTQPVNATAVSETLSAQPQEATPTTGVNGTIETRDTERGQDTEMSNAT